MASKSIFAVQVVNGPLFDNLTEEEAWSLFRVKIQAEIEDSVLLLQGGRKVAELKPRYM